MMKKYTFKQIINGVITRLRRYACLTRVQTFHIIAVLARPIMKHKHYWILLERGVDAQDNAWHLLRYIRKEHPEVNVRFAIRKSSPDYKSNLKEYQDVVVEYNSLKYYLLLFNADVMASTHIQTYLYPHVLTGMVKGGLFDMTGRKIFLQHGVLHRVIKPLVFPQIDVDMIVCGAKIEHDLLLKEYNYPASIAVHTGLARFDNLYDCKLKKQILIMPTWRIMFASLSVDEFSECDFFKSYKALLTDRRLLSKLEEKGFEIAYYNHFEFQKFNSCFQSLCSKNVHLVPFGSIRVQELLKQSMVLVTDFSSIYYDFLYMGKPIVFIAQDEDKFSATQYGKRYDGSLSDFGYATFNNDEAVSALLNILDSDCRLEPKFIEQQKRVFPVRDRNNCERIYNSILQLQ